MILKIIYPALAIFITEYWLQTFVKEFKYHEAGLFIEFMPLVLVIIISAINYPKAINQKNRIKSILLFNIIALSGYLIVNVILYFQWYWIIEPKYRSYPGDMQEGLMWGVMSFVIGSIMITTISSAVIAIMGKK